MTSTEELNNKDISPIVECNNKPDCPCQECSCDKWGDEQIEEYGEDNIETSRGL